MASRRTLFFSTLLRVSPALALRPLASPLVTRSLHQLRSPSALAVAAPSFAARIGAVRMMSSDTVVGRCKDKITTALEPKEVDVQGAFDDPNGAHITIYCVSEKFEGKRSLARQQMVYKAIWDEMDGQGGTVHAVDTMQLKAPSEV